MRIRPASRAASRTALRSSISVSTSVSRPPSVAAFSICANSAVLLASSNLSACAWASYPCTCEVRFPKFARVFSKTRFQAKIAELSPVGCTTDEKSALRGAVVPRLASSALFSTEVPSGAPPAAAGREPGVDNETSSSLVVMPSSSSASTPTARSTALRRCATRSATSASNAYRALPSKK